MMKFLAGAAIAISVSAASAQDKEELPVGVYLEAMVVASVAEAWCGYPIPKETGMRWLLKVSDMTGKSTRRVATAVDAEAILRIKTFDEHDLYAMCDAAAKTYDKFTLW